MDKIHHVAATAIDIAKIVKSSVSIKTEAPNTRSKLTDELFTAKTATEEIDVCPPLQDYSNTGYRNIKTSSLPTSNIELVYNDFKNKFEITKQEIKTHQNSASKLSFFKAVFNITAYVITIVAPALELISFITATSITLNPIGLGTLAVSVAILFLVGAILNMKSDYHAAQATQLEKDNSIRDKFITKINKITVHCFDLYKKKFPNLKKTKTDFDKIIYGKIQNQIFFILSKQDKDYSVNTEQKLNNMISIVIENRQIISDAISLEIIMQATTINVAKAAAAKANISLKRRTNNQRSS